MSNPESYQGTTQLLEQPTAYYVHNVVEADGTEVRTLTFDRPPFLPTELHDLMTAIAPAPRFNDIRGMKGDLELLTAPVGSEANGNKSLARMHYGAFGKYWLVMSKQAQQISDFLPWRFTDAYAGLHYGQSDLVKTIKSIDNGPVRSELLRNQRLCLIVAEPFDVGSDGSVSVPKTPIVTVPNQDGQETYVKRASLRIEDDALVTRTYGFTPNGIGKIVIDKVGRRIPIWETHHVPNEGIAPVITWRKQQDGSLAFEHADPTITQSEHAGVTWNNVGLSVAGCAVLASLTPEVRRTWFSREGFKPQSKTTQSMGALQATLKSVIDADKLLQGGFVQHIEQSLAA